MKRLGIGMGMLVVGLVTSVALLGGNALDAQTKLRGYLPPNWGKLGLSTEQKQKVYAVQAKYDSKIAELEKQIQELKKQEREEMEAVLTEGQKTRLREIVLKKVPDVSPPKEEDKK